MQLPSFTSLTSLLMAGALSVQLAGCGQGAAEDDVTTTSGALVRATAVAVADTEPVVADAPLVVKPNVLGTAVTATTATATLVDTSSFRVDLDRVLAQDFQFTSDESSWSSPATLSYYGCRDGSGQRRCGNNKPSSILKTIGWGTVEPRKVVPNAKVRFGPFHLKKSMLVFSSQGGSPTVTYTVSVWARSPAVYGGDGAFLGAQANLVKIAEETRQITEDNREEDIYITATLPSVFTALQLRASVDDTGLALETSSYPAACSSLPPSASNPEALDAPCLQAALNPMAVVSPRWLPLSIIYEPPGNCSWANLTQQHTAGAAISVQHSTSTSTNTVKDAGFFWDQEHSDYTSEQMSASSRRTQVTVKRSGSFGTRLGLPLSNPGNPDCNVPTADVPPRPDAGPGRGDVFVLLKNPSLLYWDSANMTNATFSPFSSPGNAESVVVVTAHQIATGTGLPPGVSFTDEERDALLALDPFVASPTGTPPASRYIALDILFELGRGIAAEHTLSQEQTTNGTTTLTEHTKSKSSSTTSDPVVDLAMKGLQFGSSQAATAGASAALTGLGGDFAGMADDIETLSMPELYKDKSTTTVVTSYGKSTLLEKTDGKAVTQQFFIQDTGQGMNVGLYYDRIFGTYAFGPPPAATTPGVVTIRPAGPVQP